MASDPPRRPEASTLVQVRLASSPRPGREVNEDLVAAVGSCAWVLDGASVPTASEACCLLDTRWYVEHLSTFLSEILGDGSRIELHHALEAAIEHVTDEHRALCSQVDRASGPSATLGLIRRRGNDLDWLVLGDSTVLLDLGDSVECHSDKRLSSVAPELREEIRANLLSGRGYDAPGHARLVSELVAAERTVPNTEGLLDRGPRPERRSSKPARFGDDRPEPLPGAAGRHRQ